MAANAFVFSFESLEMCSSCQATKFPSRRVTRLTYLVMRSSLVSYSPFTCSTTNRESLLMIIFSEDTEIARSIPTMIASYSASLLEARKSKHMACSIISPVGALSCSLRPSPVCCETPSTFRVHQPKLSIPFLVEEFPLSQSVPTSLTPSEVYIEYRTHLVQLPTDPFVLIGRAYI